MKIILILAVLITPLFAKTEKELIAISKIAHSNDKLLPQLDIFVIGRKFSIKVKILHPENIANPELVTSSEKVVKGKYLVSEIFTGEGEGKMNLLMVTTYSKELKSYQKWVLNKNTSDVREFTGIRIPDTRIISWMMTATNVENDMKTLMAETNTENGCSWIESYYKDDKLVFSLSGTAIKIK